MEKRKNLLWTNEADNDDVQVINHSTPDCQLTGGRVVNPPAPGKTYVIRGKTYVIRGSRKRHLAPRKDLNLAKRLALQEVDLNEDSTDEVAEVGAENPARAKPPPLLHLDETVTGNYSIRENILNPGSISTETIIDNPVFTSAQNAGGSRTEDFAAFENEHNCIVSSTPPSQQTTAEHENETEVRDARCTPESSSSNAQENTLEGAFQTDPNLSGGIVRKKKTFIGHRWKDPRLVDLKSETNLLGSPHTSRREVSSEPVSKPVSRHLPLGPLGKWLLSQQEESSDEESLTENLHSSKYKDVLKTAPYQLHNLNLCMPNTSGRNPLAAQLNRPQPPLGQQQPTNAQQPAAAMAMQSMPGSNNPAIQLGFTATDINRINCSFNLKVSSENILKMKITKSSGWPANTAAATIWMGNLDFREKSIHPHVQPPPRVVHSLTCSFSSLVTSSGFSNVIADTWPSRLVMQLIPRQIIVVSSLFSTLKTASRPVLIHFSQQTDALNKLCKNMSSGLVGCIQFPATCDIRIMVVLYLRKKHIYIGFIAHDQEFFFNSIKQINETLRKQQQQRQQPGTSSSAALHQPPNRLPQASGPSTSQSQQPGTTRSADDDSSGRPGPSAASATKDRRNIWQGILDFEGKTNHSQAQGQTVVHPFTCTFSSRGTSSRDSEVNAERWPSQLLLRSIPKQLIEASNLLSTLKTAGRRVRIHFSRQTNAFKKLKKNLKSGMVGCIQFPAMCDIRIMVVLYMPEKHKYVGLIAQDQEGFWNSIKQIFETLHKQQQQRLLANIPPSDGSMVNQPNRPPNSNRMMQPQQPVNNLNPNQMSVTGINQQQQPSPQPPQQQGPQQVNPPPPQQLKVAPQQPVMQQHSGNANNPANAAGLNQLEAARQQNLQQPGTCSSTAVQQPPNHMPQTSGPSTSQSQPVNNLNPNQMSVTGINQQQPGPQPPQQQGPQQVNPPPPQHPKVALQQPVMQKHSGNANNPANAAGLNQLEAARQQNLQQPGTCSSTAVHQPPNHLPQASGPSTSQSNAVEYESADQHIDAIISALHQQNRLPQSSGPSTSQSQQPGSSSSAALPQPPNHLTQASGSSTSQSQQPGTSRMADDDSTVELSVTQKPIDIESKASEVAEPEIEEVEVIEEVIEVPKRLLCKICWTKECNVTFEPCRHLATCMKCAKDLKNCPICRCFITKRNRIIIPMS